jgi:hypothetical protein
MRVQETESEKESWTLLIVFLIIQVVFSVIYFLVMAFFHFGILFLIFFSGIMGMNMVNFFRGRPIHVSWHGVSANLDKVFAKPGYIFMGIFSTAFYLFVMIGLIYSMVVK